MRHPGNVMRAFRAICAMKHADWAAISASAHARTLWGYEPVAVLILNVAKEFAAATDEDDPQLDEVVEMARNWLVLPIQQERFDSMDTLLKRAKSALREELAVALDRNQRSRRTNETPKKSRGLSTLLAKFRLSENASNEEISRASGVPIDKVRQLRTAHSLARQSHSEFKAIHRTDDGDFKRLVRNRRRWLDGRDSDSGWAGG